MAIALGRIDWGMHRDKEGHRHYNVKWLVQAAATTEGPALVLSAAGLPTPGTPWAFGVDADPWAFCSPECNVRPQLVREPGVYWTVEQNFTTKPMKRCQETTIEDPLLEPPVIEGSFAKYVRAAIKDREDVAIENSARELITDPALVERDDGKPTVLISMNVPMLDLGLVTSLMNHLNEGDMWGLDPKCVKLSDWRWQRLLYGVCNYFYRVTYEFEIDEEGFDRVGYDVGTQFLKPGGDPGNQEHYEKYRDASGELAKCFLDGAGGVLPAGDAKIEIEVKLYSLGDLFLLGVPATL